IRSSAAVLAAQRYYKMAHLSFSFLYTDCPITSLLCLYGYLQNGKGLITILFCQDQRRNHTDNAASDGSHKKLSVKASLLDVHCIDCIVKFNSYKESLSSDFFYMRKLFQFFHEIIAHSLCVSREISDQKPINHSKRRLAAYRAAAECRAVGSMNKCRCHFCCGTYCSDWHSAAHSLCHGYDILLDPVIHIG